jgi:putative transposase
MVLYRRSRVANAPYFLTAALRERRSKMLTERIDDLRFAFRETMRTSPFCIEAVVVLPDHFHLLCSLPENDADFSTRMRSIKRSFTVQLVAAGVPLQKNARGEYDLWQRRFWEHTVRDENDFSRHVDYIHYNPVKHGWTNAAKDWPFSSFHRYVRRGLLPEDWGGATEQTHRTQAGE